MSKLDSKHWSYFHGCKLHPGQCVPCRVCIDTCQPDITDTTKAYTDPTQTVCNYARPEPVANIRPSDRAEDWAAAFCEYYC